MEYLTKISTYIPYFGRASEGYQPVDLTGSNETTLFNGRNIQLVIPERPLAASLQIISKISHFQKWNVETLIESQELINTTLNRWQRQGIRNYVIYGKQSNKLDEVFSWELIPYSTGGWNGIKNVSLYKNIAFGASKISEHEIKKISEDFLSMSNSPETQDNSTLSESLIEPPISEESQRDPICAGGAITRQSVFEGKTTHIFYSGAPISIGGSQAHFIIAPKEHREKFTDLSSEEFLETMQFAKELSGLLGANRLRTCYMFAKTGSETGEKYPHHWHLDLVYTAIETSEFVGKLQVFKSLLTSRTNLPTQQFDENLKFYRELLKNLQFDKV